MSLSIFIASDGEQLYGNIEVGDMWLHILGS